MNKKTIRFKLRHVWNARTHIWDEKCCTFICYHTMALCHEVVDLLVHVHRCRECSMANLSTISSEQTRTSLWMCIGAKDVRRSLPHVDLKYVLIRFKVLPVCLSTDLSRAVVLAMVKQGGRLCHVAPSAAATLFANWPSDGTHFVGMRYLLQIDPPVWLDGSLHQDQVG